LRIGALVLCAGGLLFGACGPAPPEPLPEGSFAFGVFGDGPYYAWERGPYRRVLRDVAESDVEWLIHVGDILWYPCSDAEYEKRRDQLDELDVPVIYTPGDNEWTDCHEQRPGGYEPLDRLESLRRIFFDDPLRSLGGRPIALESQGSDDRYGEFVENARWRYRGFVFATAHVVGSSNGMDPWPGRTEEHDEAATRRMDAALAWLDETFEEARRDSALGVVIAIHANPGLDPEFPRTGYERWLDALGRNVSSFDGPVLMVHGDSHTQRVDQPLLDDHGEPYPNFTRAETFGSPEIGWIRVVVDTVERRFVSFEPRWMRGYW
jgi:hypothetical protein